MRARMKLEVEVLCNIRDRLACTSHGLQFICSNMCCSLLSYISYFVCEMLALVTFSFSYIFFFVNYVFLEQPCLTDRHITTVTSPVKVVPGRLWAMVISVYNLWLSLSRTMPEIYYYNHFYNLYEGYLQLYTWNTPCF